METGHAPVARGGCGRRHRPAALTGRAQRSTYLAGWKQNLELDVAGLASDGKDLDAALAWLKQRGGRAYAGMQSPWGPQFQIGGTPMAAFLLTSQVPSVSFPYNASALPTDIMLRFNERDPAFYRLFNVRVVLAPQSASLPDFLQPEATMGRFQVLSAPGSGYFDVVDVTEARAVTRETFFDIADPWLRAQGRYVRLDFNGEPATDLPAAQAWPVPAGKVLSPQGRTTLRGCVELSRPAFVLFRMTWHPAWKVLVDGHAVNTAMLTPGFLGVTVPAGRHDVFCKYAPANTKVWMAFAGLALAVVFGVGRRFLLAKL